MEYVDNFYLVFFYLFLLFLKWHARQQITCTKVLKKKKKRSETQEVKLLRWWFGWFKAGTSRKKCMIY